jgi:hypothetical protein
MAFFAYFLPFILLTLMTCTVFPPTRNTSGALGGFTASAKMVFPSISKTRTSSGRFGVMVFPYFLDWMGFPERP